MIQISPQQYTIFAWIWIAIAAMVFILLLFVTAPYGRHTKSTWGPLINNKWGWFLMEITLIIVLAFFIYTGVNNQSLVNWIIIGLISFHYLNRSIVFPLRIRTGHKKMPIVIMMMGIFFNVVNGFLFGYFLGNFKVYTIEWIHTLPFILGILIFLAGTIINWRADNILIHLRRPGETGYKIPMGGLFRYISCPNLFGEIVEWLGFAILTWSLPGLAFFVWTFANLAPRAIAHHRWYQKTFSDYPRERRAVFPYLW
jgi:protein-S-isoprenylcysteine O-methyltransferase Ste14